MKLVVGLGNPGRKYRDTRHNIGFEVLAEIHRRFDSPRPFAKFTSEIVELRIADEKVLLQSPLTYMNLSGQAVRAATDFYKLPVDQLLVICDDFHLPLGRIRFRPSGSAGGQNGLKDIIRHLGTDQFARLRIGIGQSPDQMDVSDYVLSKFAPDELVTIRKAISRAADGVETWIQSDIQACMSRFNADPDRRPAGDVAGDQPRIRLSEKKRVDTDQAEDQ